LEESDQVFLGQECEHLQPNFQGSRRLKFSLILATVGRVAELGRFLRSLAAQSYPDYEPIVVDQNPDDRLAQVLRGYEGQIPLKHIRSEPGLSRARNVGLKFADGDIVAFPDDDCWYPADLLARVARFFEDHPEYDGLTGRLALPTGEPCLGWDDRPGLVTKSNVWRRGMSVAVFLRRRAIAAIGNFDETLGIGSGTPWGSGEETDYLLSTLERGFKIVLEPSILVFHPPLAEGYDRAARRKAYTYGQGMGRVLRKHDYSPFQTWRYFFLPLRSVVYSFLTGRPRRALLGWAMFQGRLVGYMGDFKNECWSGIDSDGSSPAPSRRSHKACTPRYTRF
jgi:glycosyltransferase involved in cell wall biosynthesis